jgi:hypothetical protein
VVLILVALESGLGGGLRPALAVPPACCMWSTSAKKCYPGRPPPRMTSLYLWLHSTLKSHQVTLVCNSHTNLISHFTCVFVQSTMGILQYRSQISAHFYMQYITSQYFDTVLLVRDNRLLLIQSLLLTDGYAVPFLCVRSCSRMLLVIFCIE